MQACAKLAQVDLALLWIKDVGCLRSAKVRGRCWAVPLLPWLYRPSPVLKAACKTS